MNFWHLSEANAIKKPAPRKAPGIAVTKPSASVAMANDLGCLISWQRNGAGEVFIRRTVIMAS